MTNKPNAFIDQMPFWHTEGDLMVYADGSLGAALCLEGVDIKSSSHAQLNDLTGGLENFVGSLPEEFTLQFFYRANPRVGHILREHGNLSQKAPAKYAPILKSRLNFFKEREKNGEFFAPEIFLFVRGKSQTVSKKKFWESEKAFVQTTHAQFEKQKQDFLKKLKHIESGLHHAQIKSKRLSMEKWFKLLFEFFNWERVQKIGYPALRSNTSAFEAPFSSQFLLTDAVVHKSFVELGKTYFRAITLKNLPEEETHACMIEDLLTGLPFHFVLSQTVEVCHQKRETEKLELSRRLAHSMASGAKNVSDLESESKLQHIEELLSELLGGSEKIVKSGLSIIVWDTSPAELENKAEEVLKSLRELGQAEGLMETLTVWDVFRDTMPGACKHARPKKMKSSNCAHLLPVYAPWKGHKEAVCLFENRDNGLFSFGPFAVELPSWNGLIFAASGSGKSFAVLQMAMQFYGTHPTPRIVWIDNGASSKRMLDESILDGQFIELSLDSKLCLNMFDLPKGTTTPTPSKIKLVLAILEQILREEHQTGLPKKHKALLEEAVYSAYDQAAPRIPTLSTLKEILARHESGEMQSYAQSLYPWTGKTAYGKILDGETNIDLTKNLITIETKGLDTYPDLQNVMLLNFTEFIKSRASSDSTRPTLLIIDEAWKLLETPSGRDFTIEAYRTFRKFGAGIWSISQNYKDFLANEDVANALFANTATLFILKQGKIDWEDFQKRLQLSEEQTEIAKSLKSQKGEFSELLLIQNDKEAVVKITPDPLAYSIATSDPFDVVAIKEEKQRNPRKTQLEVLQTLIEEKEHETLS